MVVLGGVRVAKYDDHLHDPASYEHHKSQVYCCAGLQRWMIILREPDRQQADIKPYRFIISYAMFCIYRSLDSTCRNWQTLVHA